MSQSNTTVEFFRATKKLPILLGACGILVAFLGIFTPLRILLFFSACPLYYSYMTLGSKAGHISSSIVGISLFLLMPVSAFADILLNIIVPAVLIGSLINRNITQRRKKWWYPESFLLRDFTVLAICSVIFLSLTFYRQDVVLKAYEEAFNVLKNMDSLKDIQKELSILVHPFIKFSVGIGIFIKMLATVINFRLAQILAQKNKKNLRPNFNFLNLSIPNWMALLPLLSLSITLTFENCAYVFGGVFIVSSFAPLICGFSLFHDFAKRSERNWLLILLYSLLFFTPFFMLTSLVFLGIIDSFYDFRTKFTKITD